MHAFLKWVLLSAFTCQCTYRFSNLYKKAPSGVQSLAIEAIYDSSKNIIPHEILWDSLQRQVITSGKIALAPTNRADALLRVQIKNTERMQFNAEFFKETEDPKTFISPLTHFPYLPQEYIDAKVASYFAKWEKVAYIAHVEIWDLRTQKLLSQRVYPVAFDRKTFHSITPNHHRYLYLTEGMENAFSSSAQTLAERIIGDFLG